MMHTRRGQIEMTFNWVYILIAGAVILLFFVGLVVRQQASSEQRLTVDVVESMQRIFTAASVSEKTKNFIDTSGLADYTFYFDCKEGVGEYGIEGGTARVQIPHDPIFAPATFQTSLIITWSLPYEFPFKVMDLLFVTSKNTQYYVVGEGNGFAREFLNATEGINTGPSHLAKPILTKEQYHSIDPGENYQVRIMDLSGFSGSSSDSNPSSSFSVLRERIPPQLAVMEDDKVTAVVFTAADQVDYYVKQGSAWEKIPSTLVQSTIIYSLNGERDAAKYASVFAADAEAYQCNMHKVFRRLGYLTNVYLGKAKDLESYYASRPVLAHTTFCQLTLQEKVIPSLEVLGTTVALCQQLPTSCAGMVEPVQQLRDANEELLREGCITLY